ADAEFGAFPAIELPGIAAHRRVAVGLDVVEHRANALGNGAVGLLRPRLRLLEIVDHGASSPSAGLPAIIDATRWTAQARGCPHPEAEAKPKAIRDLGQRSGNFKIEVRLA